MTERPTDIVRLSTPVREEAWIGDAACREHDPSIWFVSPGHSKGVAQARLICSTCPAATDCLDYALRVNERHGIYGGFTARERMQMRSGRSTRVHGNDATHRARSECGCHLCRAANKSARLRQPGARLTK